MPEQPAGVAENGDIHFEWTIEHSPAEVWPHLVDADLVSRWLAPRIVIEPHVGGKVVVDWGAEDGSAEGEVIEIDKDRVLAFTWGGEGWPEVSAVRWELRPSGAGSSLRLSHTGLTGPDKRVRDLAAGWHDFLDGLLAELGEKEHPQRYADLMKEYAEH